MKKEEAIKLIDERMCFGRGVWTKNHLPERDIYWEAGEEAISALKMVEDLPKQPEWCAVYNDGVCGYPIAWCFECPKHKTQQPVRCMECMYHAESDDLAAENNVWCRVFMKTMKSEDFCSLGTV